MLEPPRAPPLEPAPLPPAPAPQALRNSPPPQAAEPIVVPDQDEEPAFDVYVAQVLEIIPDALPAHVFSLIEQYYPNHKDRVVETVLHNLFENPDYPKADAKGKGKRKREGEGEPQDRAVKPKVDYGDKTRRREGGLHYVALALEALDSEFVYIPSAHIRAVFNAHSMLYAPTYLELLAQQRRVPLPYKPMMRPRNKGKGKRVQKHDDELDLEMQWVRERLEEEEARRVAEAEEEARLKEEGGIECGCCFCEYPFDKMIQCPEAHLFCTSCMLTYAETKLGEHDARIVCMDQSGCKLAFPESELRRFLTPKLLELYERVKQRKEIEAAGLEGLEECPFCEYKVVIENDEERLFRCENEGCGAVTCRKCKKLDHLPKSCKEAEDDKKLDARHAIEEAMTHALMRNCPKCQKAFIKEMGCNKMTCPNCGTLSCYICRKIIQGYDHFNQASPSQIKSSNPNKCALWDASGVEGRHSDEVAAAAKRALEEYRRAHPEIDEKDLHVELPPPPPPPAPGPARVGAPAHPHLPPHPQGVAQAHVHQGFAGVQMRVARAHAAAQAAMELVQQQQQQQQRLQQAFLPRLVQAAGPVFNFQLHINHNQPQAGPAHPQPGPVLAPALPPLPVAAPIRARARRPARARARR
ncbi:hypothetical protein BD309DRAFT_873009 [Dichomitus squalens]|uniref:Uncharacterized protein n=1 Tax=Dichomitus squalens TaxID=114155 RepID=A0A4Q9NDM3_9APHY|nr:hypothetical protein BD309DRAFT_873009 [Dichomitus squalens]TBU53884.1 hypothetical protein BD310DRAFT_829143 [Dichomitus squalens]